MKARLEGNRVRLIGKKWEESFALEKLPGRIDLYKKLRDRANGCFSEYHSETVQELERIEKEARQAA